VLEDYGDVAEGLFSLYAVTGEARWLTAALMVVDAALLHFADGQGGFYDTADDAEELVRRPRDVADNAAPSGHAAIAGALVTAAAYTGSTTYRDAATAALSRVGRLALDAPRFAGWSLAVAEALECGPLEVAVVGAVGDPAAATMRRAAWLATSPGAVVAWGDPGPADGSTVALLSGRPLVDGGAASYVCRQFVCEAPTTSVEELAAAVGALSTLLPGLAQ